MQISITTADIDGYPSSQATQVNDSGKRLPITKKNEPIPDVNLIPNLLANFPSGKTGVMNPGLRYLSGDRRVMVFEQPPRYVQFFYTSTNASDTGSSKAKTRQYNIPVPWLAYCALLDNDAQPVTVYVFTLQHQIKSLDDPIAVLPLTNFFQDGKLCRAPADVNELGFPRSIAGAMGAVFYSVWMTGFNNDLINILQAAYQQGNPKFLRDFNYDGSKNGHGLIEHWSQQSLATVATSKYVPTTRKTLKEFIDARDIHKDFEVNEPTMFVQRLHSTLANGLI